MARSKTIDLEALARRGARAMGALGWVRPEDLPESYHRPEVFRMLLSQIGAELPSKQARSKEFLAARSAVEAWAAAQELADRAVRLYHDPAVRSVAGSQETLDYYWAHPEEALKIVAQHSAKFPKGYTQGPLGEVLETIAAVQSFHQTHASSGPEPAEQTPAAAVAHTPPSGATRSSAAAQDRSRPSAKPAPGPNGANPRRRADAEWSAAIASYEQRHLPDEADDPAAPLPDSYYGPEKESQTND